MTSINPVSVEKIISAGVEGARKRERESIKCLFN